MSELNDYLLNPPMQPPQGAMPPIPMRPMTGNASGASPFDEEQAPPMAGMMPQGLPPVGKEQFHNTMADFDHRKEANRAAMIGLDPSDPEYTKKLSALQAQHGALTTEKARFQMLHPWGGPEGGDMPAMPQYGGPGKPVAQGQMIPPKQLPQDEFKFKNQELKDKTAAAEGDANSWAEARGEEARHKLDNPWGSPGNHPGVLGKIGHVVGTIGTMGVNYARPEYEAQQGAAAQKEEGAEGLQKAETEQKTAQAGLEDAQTEAARHPKPEKPESPQQVYADAVQDALSRGVDPNTDPHVKQVADTITAIQKEPNAPKQGAEEQFVDEYRKAHPDATVAQAQHAFKQNESVNEPGNYVPVNNAQGGTIGWVDPKSKHFVSVQDVRGLGPQGGGTPGATPNAPGGVIPPKPTAQMRNVDAQAEVAAQGIPGVISEIDKLKDLLGPVSGRWNEFMQGRIGMENPEMAGLRADLLMVSSAVALAHARGRLPETLREEFDRAINAPKQSPENLKAVLSHIMPWMQRMSTMGQGSPGTATPEGNAPAALGSAPSFAQWKSSQGAAPPK